MSANEPTDTATRVHKWLHLVETMNPDRYSVLPHVTVDDVRELLQITDLAWLADDSETEPITFATDSYGPPRYLELVTASPIWRMEVNRAADPGVLTWAIGIRERAYAAGYPRDLNPVQRLVPVVRMIVAYFGLIWHVPSVESHRENWPMSIEGTRLPASGIYRVRTPREYDELRELGGYLLEQDDQATGGAL